MNRLFALVAAILISHPIIAGAAEKVLMGVFPFMPIANIEGLFAPIARDIGKALGRTVTLVSAPSYEKFALELKGKAYDIAFIQPFDYVLVGKPNGYLPLAKRSDTLQSFIVVKAGSPVQTLQGLKGKTVGMAPENAAVSHLNRVLFQSEGFEPETDVTFKYFNSHIACLQQLLVNNVDACGVAPPPIRLVEQQQGVAFKLLAKSPVIPTPLFVVKGTLPAPERDAIKRVLLQTRLDDVRPDLRKMFFVEGQEFPFVAATDREYDKVRAMMRKRAK